MPQTMPKITRKWVNTAEMPTGVARNFCPWGPVVMKSSAASKCGEAYGVERLRLAAAAESSVRTVRGEHFYRDSSVKLHQSDLPIYTSDVSRQFVTISQPTLQVDVGRGWGPDLRPAMHSTITQDWRSVSRGFHYIYILTAVLLGCIASWPVTGWRLCPNNSTQITDGCGIDHDHPSAMGTRQLLYSRCMQPAGDNCWHCYRLHYSRRPARYWSPHGAKRRGELVVCGMY